MLDNLNPSTPLGMMMKAAVENADNKSMKEFAKEWLAKPAPEVHIADLKALCEHFNIKCPAQFTNADMANLNACAASQVDCESCHNSTSRVKCFKYFPYLDGERIKCRKEICNKKYAYKLIDESGIPKKFADVRGRDYKVSTSNARALNAAYQAVKNDEGVFIYGKVGTGKTMLSSIIITERAMLGKSSCFYTVTDMLDELRDFDNPVARAGKLRKVKCCPCLVIDDLGAEYVSDWVSSTLFEILDARYKANLCTVINSNLAIGDIAKRYTGIHGDRIARRIKELCTLTDIF